MDVESCCWPESNRLRHDIVDGGADGDRSPVMSPPTSQRDDPVVAEVLCAGWFEGVAEGEDQRGGLGMVAIAL